ncbi:MAG: nucleoside deaminase [Alphaproteobacteria bacterium]|nr:nucleoside deaminase [Alphaproteobacteria bacterium]
MAEALAEAEAAAGRGEVPVGCVLVDPASGQILARAGNRTLELSDPTAHAEMLAIRAAAAAVGSQRLAGCDLYVTLEPCPMCAQAIAFARIRRLYFGAEDPKGGGVLHGPRIFAQPTCHHRPDVYGGIGESRAAALLRDFFRMRR